MEKEKGKKNLSDDSKFTYILRNKHRVIRYVKYNRVNDEYNYCREHLMLFHPWRNENQDVIDVDAIDLCKKYAETIISNKAKYVYNTNIDEGIEHAVNRVNNENDTPRCSYNR